MNGKGNFLMGMAVRIRPTFPFTSSTECDVWLTVEIIFCSEFHFKLIFRFAFGHASVMAVVIELSHQIWYKRLH